MENISYLEGFPCRGGVHRVASLPMVSVTSEQHELHTTCSTELSGPQWRLHGLLANITHLRGTPVTPVAMMSVKTQRLGDPEQG